MDINRSYAELIVTEREIFCFLYQGLLKSETVEARHKNNQDLDFITQATGMTKYLVKQYIEILHQL